MEHIPFQTSWVLGWLFDSTICISILICLILAIKAVTKGKLPAWWSYGLWLLLLLRMLMPWGIESRMSVFNYLPAPLENESYMPFLIEHDLTIPLTQDNFDTAKTTPASNSTDADLATKPAHRYDDSKESNRFHFSLSLDNALLILWFAGVMLFGIKTLFKNFMFWLTIRGLPSIKDNFSLHLFEKCRSSLSIRKNIAVIVTDRVKSPALFGYFKPRLLLPPHFLDTLQEDDLRYIFIVSEAQLLKDQKLEGAFVSKDVEGLSIRVEKASGEKCERCWVHDTSVGSNSEQPTICNRCQNALAKMQ